jgi:PTH1 family peptidyl-tRNA hydrolase
MVLGGQFAVLAAPQTFMNKSGAALPPLFERFGTSPGSMIVVYDDLALPLGKLRIRQKGSAGGHNGIKSIISTLAADEFLRVRVGIRPEREIGDVRDFVLSPVASSDRSLLHQAEEIAGRAVETLIADGVERAMAEYNGIDLREGSEDS